MHHYKASLYTDAQDRLLWRDKTCSAHLPSLFSPDSVLIIIEGALGLQTLEEYSSKYKEEGEEFKTLINGVLPEGWADNLPTFTEKDKGIATRLHSQTMLNALAPVLPGFWGGSAGASNFCSSLYFGMCECTVSVRCGDLQLKWF